METTHGQITQEKLPKNLSTNSINNSINDSFEATGNQVATLPEKSQEVEAALEPTRTPPSAKVGLALGLAMVGIFGGALWLRGQTAPMNAGSERRAQTAQADEAPRLSVTMVTVKPLTTGESNLLSGQVEPYHVATLAAEYPNRIESRPVQQGDHVPSGAVLVRLDAVAAEIGLKQAQSALSQARAARIQAETDYRRAEIETDAARQQARAQVEASLSDERKAKAQVDEADATRRKTLAFSRAQEIRQAEAALAQVLTDEHLAQLEVNRYTYLVKQGATAQQVLDRAQATLDAAHARRVSAEQALSLAKEGARQEDREAALAQVKASSAQVDAARQQTEVAKATLRIAETRDTRLAVIRKQIDGLRAQEAQAVESVRQAEVALAKRVTYAPFAGRVLATYADVGDMAGAGTPLVRLAQIDRVKINVSVPEASRPSIRLHDSVTVTVDALPGRKFIGNITALGYLADARSRAFPIEITVENPKELLLPNMVARVELPVGPTSRRLVIPTGAVANDGKQSYVFFNEQGVAKRRNIDLGTPIGQMVQVVSGLKAGDHILAAPQRVTEGARIVESNGTEVQR